MHPRLKSIGELLTGLKTEHGRQSARRWYILAEYGRQRREGPNMPQTSTTHGLKDATHVVE
jgi:hypothetical protein